MIENIIYINLEERKDRKKHIIEELTKYIPEDKIIRFDAIKHEHGFIGCAKSHLECIKLARKNNWDNVMIVEDDVHWYDYSNGLQLLEKLLMKKYDVIVCAGTISYFNSWTHKLYECQSGSAYVVHKSYYSILIEHWEYYLKLLEETLQVRKYALDITWKELQWKHKWYIVYPPLFTQKEGYSSIGNKIDNPEKYFFISNFYTFKRKHQKTIIKVTSLISILYFLYINIIYLFY